MIEEILEDLEGQAKELKDRFGEDDEYATRRSRRW